MEDHTVEWESTPALLLRAVLYGARHSRRSIAPLLLMLLGAAALLSAAADLAFGVSGWMLGAVGGAMASALGVYWWFLAPRIGVRRLLADPEARAAVGRTLVHISAEGVSWRDPIGASSLGWAGVNRIERASDALIIRMGLDSGLYVPACAFTTPEEMQQFADTSEGFLAADRAARVQRQGP
jgi:hypothetical protein